MESNDILKVNNLTVKFGDERILDNLSFSVNKGDILALVGPNGAGKTVLFKTLLGLLPYSGHIQWKNGLKIGYVPQRFVIDKDFPLSVKEFSSFKRTDVRDMVSALKLVGIGAEHKNEPDHQLRHIHDHI